jgi:outer membrane autotransporter protein
LTDSLHLDTYVQYIWQRQSGDTVTLSSGETLAFMPVNSQRGRLGARLDEDFNKSITGYIGAAYEQEFDGQADATTNGLPITSPSMKGTSGMVELGVKGHPLSDKAFTLGAGVQGYFGQKQGVTGNLIIGYLF